MELEMEMGSGDGNHTPVCEFPTEVFAGKGDQDHGEEQLELLHAGLPLPLGILVVRVVVGVEVLGGGRGQGVDLVVVVFGARYVGYGEGLGERHGRSGRRR